MIFEKIREKIEKLSLQQKMKSASIFCEEDYIKSTQKQYVKQSCDMQAFTYDKAIDIINQVEAEYNNGWIPCSERLPEEAFGCLVTVMDCEPMTGNEYENILPYHVGFDGETWNDSDGKIIPFEVIAWQPLPEPYTPKGE